MVIFKLLFYSDGNANVLSETHIKNLSTKVSNNLKIINPNQVRISELINKKNQIQAE